MKILILVGLCCFTINVNANTIDKLISDEKMKQFILLENNSQKCFQPELWYAKTETEKQLILNKRSEMEEIREQQYQIAIMNDIFGEAVSKRIFNNDELLTSFYKKYASLDIQQVTAETEEACQQVSDFYNKAFKKYF